MIAFKFLLFVALVTCMAAKAEEQKFSCVPDFVGVRLSQSGTNKIFEAIVQVEAFSADLDSVKMAESEARMEAKAQLNMYMEHMGFSTIGGGVIARIICRQDEIIYASALYDPKNEEKAKALKVEIQNSQIREVSE